MKQTTIKIKENVWEFLNKEKSLGEDFNDVLIRLLKIYTQLNNTGGNTNGTNRTR